MHVAEGTLSGPVLIGGAALAVAGISLGLRRLSPEDIPRVAVVGAAFFVASLIHVPIGPSSAHLILNGLAGLILGWAAFPALTVALFLQAVLFGFGGLTSLGVNAVVMAGPAVAVRLLLGRPARSPDRRVALAAGFGAGVVGVGLGCLFLALALFLSAQGFVNVARLAVAAHLPVMAVEGLITAFVVVFLGRVRPDLLED